MSGTVTELGRTDGLAVFEIELVCASGARARILSWGATLRDLQVPDSNGTLRRVVLGYDDLDSYIANPDFLGATCGRVANRIRGGSFALHGRTYTLARNEKGITHLHGGQRGFSHRPWRLLAADASSVTLAYTSPDLEEGYPGTLEVRCTYRLVAAATLTIEMSATTDADTPVNLAHHSYFTLDPGASVRELEIEVAAGHYTPVDAALIPTGELAPVEGTRFDLRRSRRLGDGPGLYDINYVLDPETGPEPRFAARARSPRTGAAIEIWTTEPGLQLYDGSYLRPTAHGLGGQEHGKNAGICFEAQNFPDAVNQAGFPSPILRPGDTYTQATEYRFLMG